MAFLGSLQLEHGTPAGTARFRCVQLLRFVFRVVRFLALNLSSRCLFAFMSCDGCFPRLGGTCFVASWTLSLSVPVRFGSRHWTLVLGDRFGSRSSPRSSGLGRLCSGVLGSVRCRCQVLTYVPLCRFHGCIRERSYMVSRDIP